MLDLHFVIQILFALFIAGVSLGGQYLVLRRTGSKEFVSGSGEIAFLFDGDELIDATRPARALLRSKNGSGAALERLIVLLSPRFPDLRSALCDVADIGELHIFASDGDPGQVHLQSRNGITRVSLTGEGQESAANISAKMSNQATADELESLRAMADGSPQLMWRQDVAGVITWANAPYIKLCERCRPDLSDIWPPPKVFEDLLVPENLREVRTTRHAVLPPDCDAPMWFDVTMQCSNRHNLFVAHDVTDNVRLDDMNRDVLQTLTKTFAGLETGLAVFNSDRQLVMFNPALLELTNLPAIDLLPKPRLDTFFDQLREQSVLPEPSDYVVWRRQMTHIEQAAVQGEFIERWAQPDGSCLEVSGRPFPNGAFALLFQDVSWNKMQNHAIHDAEILLNGVLNGGEKARAIFAGDGVLRAANQRYTMVWDLESQKFEDHLDAWRCGDGGSAYWDDLLKTSLNVSEPKMQFEVVLQNHGHAVVEAHHLGGGSLMVSFDFQASPQERIPYAPEVSVCELNSA